MNRKTFFKRFAIGSAAVIVAPEMMAGVKKWEKAKIPVSPIAEESARCSYINAQERADRILFQQAILHDYLMVGMISVQSCVDLHDKAGDLSAEEWVNELHKAII